MYPAFAPVIALAYLMLPARCPPAMLRSRSLLIAIVALAALIVGGRQMYRSHQREERQQAQADFRAHVFPMLKQSCWRCHGLENQKGLLRLDNPTAALKGGVSGPALVPGDPDKSLMLVRAMHNDPMREVPPKDPPTDAELAALRRWIAAGAPWPEPKEKPAKQVAAQDKIGDAWSDPRNPIVKAFNGKRLDLWSLKPISQPPLPAVKDKAWPRNEIDAFILAKIDAAQAKPAPEAAQRTLARRLYFDLTGLPPTPEELAAYLADTSPDAYHNLVTRLLNSHSYGEHWARLWLDVVRYSDSNGFDYDEFRPTAWRFRDYVVRSLNADKPYDRFVKEQLAGDEMLSGPPRDAAEQDCLTATGFLRVGPYDNSAAKFGERDRCRAQVMSDLVETTGSAFLGLTFNCCRCHDHKVDPLSHADYYRLRAFFEGIKANDDIALDLPAQHAVIQRETLAIEQAMQAVVDIENPAFKRLRDARRAALPEDKKKLLALPEEDQNDFVRDQIRQAKKSIQPSLEEALASFSSAEKAAHEAALAKVKNLESERTPPTAGFIVTDTVGMPLETRILYQGDFQQPRDEVRPGVLSALNPNPLPPARVIRENSSGRRTALAQWLFSKDNPLTARVMVNRIWQGHFGTGLVATPNDFGLAGAKPSHPELLDWLAQRFVADGWSLKKLHRLMVESATYRRGLATTTSDTQLFHHRIPRRISAESLRDSLLQVSGRLMPSAGGPPVWQELPQEVLLTSPSALLETPDKLRGWYPSPKEKTFVRTIYLVQKRSLHDPMLDAFDLPDNNASCARRPTSTVAPQALTLLNSPFMVEAAQAFAQRLHKEVGEDPEALIARAFAIAVQREPDAEERAVCTNYLNSHGLAELCRSLMNLNEFAYVD